MPSDVESPICSTAWHEVRSGPAGVAVPDPAGSVPAPCLPAPRVSDPLVPPLPLPEPVFGGGGSRLPAASVPVGPPLTGTGSAPLSPAPASATTATQPVAAAQLPSVAGRARHASGGPQPLPDPAQRPVPDRLLDEPPGQRGQPDAGRYLDGRPGQVFGGVGRGGQHDDREVPQVDAVGPDADPAQRPPAQDRADQAARAGRCGQHPAVATDSTTRPPW